MISSTWVECPDPTCKSTYIGETARRLEERVKDHTGRDHNSHLLKHSHRNRAPYYKSRTL